MANGQYQGSGNAVFRRNGDGGFLSALRNTLFGRPLTPEDLEKMLEEPIVPAEMPLGPGSIKSVLQLARGAQGVSRPAIDWVTRLMRGGGSSGTQAVQRVRPRMRAREGVALAGDVAQQTIPRLLPESSRSIGGFHAAARPFQTTEKYPLGHFQEGYLGSGTGHGTFGSGTYIAGAKPTSENYYATQMSRSEGMPILRIINPANRTKPGWRDVTTTYPLGGRKGLPKLASPHDFPWNTPTYEPPEVQTVPISNLQRYGWTSNIPKFVNRSSWGSVPSEVKRRYQTGNSASELLATQFLSSELPLNQGMEAINLALKDPLVWKRAKEAIERTLAGYSPEVLSFGSSPAYGRKGDVEEALRSSIQDLTEWEQGKGASVEAIDPGALYQVDAKVSPDTLLDLDLPLKDQAPFVRRRVTNYFQRLLDDEYSKSEVNEMTALEAMKESFRLRDSYPGELEADLDRMGVPGNKYWDQYSRKAKKGTKNYVIFDPKNIDIIRRLLAGVAAVGGGTVAEKEVRRRSSSNGT